MRPEITRKTQVRVHRGGSLSYSPPIPVDGGTYLVSMVASSIVVVEGGQRVKIQCYGNELRGTTTRVPFVVDNSAVANPCDRNTDYIIEDAAGNAVEGDYFVIPAGVLRGELFIRGLADDDLEGIQRTRIRLVSSNSDATLPGTPSGLIETEIQLQDPSLCQMQMAQANYPIAEPGPGLTATVNIGINLSTPAPSAVTAKCRVAAGTAVAGVNYQTTTENVTFVAGAQTATVPVTILRDLVHTPDLTVSFELTDVTGPAELVSGATISTITIFDQDSSATLKLRFAAAHNGIITVQEGGAVVEATVTFDDGLPNAVNTIVDWELVGDTGSGITIGGAITSSTTNPLVIPAGQVSGKIRLSAPANTTVEGDRGFTLRLLGATGGAADILPGGGELDGTLVDTTVARPTLNWVTDNRTIYEGATATLPIACSVPAPNPFTVVLQQGGTAGAGDLLLVTAEFQAGQTFAYAYVEAVQDGTVEGQEVGTIEIIPTSAYDVSNPSVITVTVNEVVSGTTNLEYKPAPAGMNTLVDCCTGLGEHDFLSPPSMTIDGVKADVFPIDQGRYGGKCRAWQIIAPVSGSVGQSIMDVDSGSASYGAGFVTDDIDDVTFVLTAYCEGSANETPAYACRIGDATNSWVNRSGHYIDDRTYFLRLRTQDATEYGTKHEYCGQVLVNVVRTPVGIRARVELLNAGYKVSSSLGHFENGALRNEISGTIHFMSFRAIGTAAIEVYGDPVKQRCTRNGYLIAPLNSGRPHKLPPLRRWTYDVALVSPDTLSTHAEALLDSTGWAVAMSGAYAFDATPWVGARGAFLPRWPDSFVEYGLSGMAAVKERARRGLEKVKNAIINGVSFNAEVWYPAELQTGAEVGTWFEPGMQAYSYAGSKNFTFMRLGFDIWPDEMLMYHYWTRHLDQCNPCTLIDIDTGRAVTQSQLALTNTVPPGVVGKVPWLEQPLGGNGYLRSQFFVPAMACKDSTHAQTYGRRPTGRKWNVHPAGGHGSGAKVDSVAGYTNYDNGDTIYNHDFYTAGYNLSSINNWSPCDEDHYGRPNVPYEFMTFSRNASWAREALRYQARRAYSIYSHLDYAGYGGNDYFYRSFNQNYVPTAMALAVSGGVPGNNQGGIELAVHGAGISRNRGAAHCVGAVAAAMVTIPRDDSFSVELQEWATVYLNAYSIIRSQYGSTDRIAHYDRIGDAGTWFAQDLPTLDAATYPNNGYAWVNPVPYGSSGGQGWKQAYHHSRLIDLATVYYGVSGLDVVEHSYRHFPFSVWRLDPVGARPAGVKPCGYVLNSLGSGGQQDNIQNETRPLPWHLVPGPATDPLFRYVGESWGTLYGAQMQALWSIGDTDAWDEMRGYLNIGFDLPQDATLAQLITKVVANAGLDADYDPAALYHAGDYSDLIGHLQYVQRTTA